MASPFPDAKQLEGKKEQPDPPPQSRDFFWDSIALYIVGVILALAAIDVIFEFVRPSDVQCYLPNDTNQSLLANVKDYVREYCTGRLPFIQFLPTFIAVHATLIYAPHFVFFNAYGADLDFFYRHVSKLERTREETSGDYPKKNYVISMQMQEVFNKSTKGNGMFWLYIFKVVMQFMVCVLGVILVPTVLFKEAKQTVTFECPSNDDDTKGDQWPLPPFEKVTCVFSPLRLLHNIWGIYWFLLALVVIIVVINFFQLVKWHIRELGFENCSEFSFQTGMSYKHYHPDVIDVFMKVFAENIGAIPNVLCMADTEFPPHIGNVRKMSKLHRLGKVLSLFLRPFTPYVIQSDYDFLMVRLFRTDGGLAYIMKELHVLSLLRGKNQLDLTNAYLYRQNGKQQRESEEKWISADIEWKLPDTSPTFKEQSYQPALDCSTLVLPPTVRGVILGCALRSEGGFGPTKLLDKLTERCVTLAENYKSNIIEGHAQQDKTNEAKNLKEKLTNDIKTLEKEKDNLKQLEQELEAARKKVQRDESSINDAQVRVDEKRSAIKVMKFKNKTTLEDEINKFERNMRRLASEQQKFATERLMEEIAAQRPQVEAETGIERFSGHIVRALQLFGTSRVAALVIGFDMESDGISSALLRVFQRVGAINFSSTFADYKNPLNMLNRTHHFFNVVVPNDALARDDLMDLPEELKEVKDNISINQWVLDQMIEVWKVNYIAMKRKDDLAPRERYEESRVDELSTFKSNYVVIGPLRTNMHQLTVDIILKHYQAYISPRVVILVLKPCKVGGTGMKFIEYKPPKSKNLSFEEIKDLNVKLGQCETWMEATTHSIIATTPSTNRRFRIRVEHTVVEYELRMYRRELNSVRNC